MLSSANKRDWFYWVAPPIGGVVLAALVAALTIALRVSEQATARPTGHLVTYVVMGALYWSLGALVIAVKPGDVTNRFGFASAMCVALQFSARTLDLFLEQLPRGEFAFSRLLFLTSPLAMVFAFEFFYRFPLGPIPGKVWTRLRWAVWALGITVWLIRVPHVWIWALGGRSLNETWVWPVEEASLAVLAIPIAAALFVNFRRVSSPDDRRRLQWIVGGVAAATVPFGLVGLLNASGRGFALDHPVTVAAELSAALVPITMMYAVLRHRTLGVQVVLRLGMQYLFAKTVLWIAVGLPIVLLAFDLILHADQSLSQLLRHNIALVILALAAGAALQRRRVLNRWIDRKFFREAYNREQLLIDLVEKITHLESLEQASELIVSTIDAALHPKRVVMFLADEGTGALAEVASHGDARGRVERLPDRVGEMLARERSVFAIPSSTGEDDGLVLSVPVSGSRSTPIGVILLGDKRSEEPYMSKDRSLLSQLGSQAGILYENQQLQHSLQKEQRIRRDVLARIDATEMNLVKECPVCGRCFDATDEACAQDGNKLTLAVPVERVLEKRYRLERRLGAGGMGTVYLAIDQRLHRTVAVKVMMGSLFGNRMAVRRFEREAQLAARLSHGNVAAVYDYGTTGSDGAYMVMEFIAGRTWRSVLRQTGVFRPVLAASRMEGLVQGVEAAHGCGLIHRDLKPENVMIGENETIKVLDFGLAKVGGEVPDAMNLTAPGTLLGTAGYMSYEQLMGEAADERSDIFALGVMATEAITGQRPFAGNTMGELARAMAKGEWRLSEDEGLNDVLARCLAREPKARFGAVSDLREVLIPALRNAKQTGPDAMSGDATQTITFSQCGLGTQPSATID